MSSNKPRFADLFLEMGWWSEESFVSWKILCLYEKVSFLYIILFDQLVSYCPYIESIKVS